MTENTPVQPRPLHVSPLLLCLDAMLSEIPRVFSTPICLLPALNTDDFGTELNCVGTLLTHVISL